VATDQGPHGPFNTEAQVLALPDVEAVYEAAHESNRHGVLREGSEAILLAACADTGADPGEYGARMIRWLADFGPQACQVFADLIRQAAHGKPGPHSVTFDLADGNNTPFVLTEALQLFADTQRLFAHKKDSNSASCNVWAERADEMRAQAVEVMREDHPST
jgi:hypothetical protein